MFSPSIRATAIYSPWDFKPHCAYPADSSVDKRRPVQSTPKANTRWSQCSLIHWCWWIVDNQNLVTSSSSSETVCHGLPWSVSPSHTNDIWQVDARLPSEQPPTWHRSTAIEHEGKVTRKVVNRVIISPFHWFCSAFHEQCGGHVYIANLPKWLQLTKAY